MRLLFRCFLLAGKEGREVGERRLAAGHWSQLSPDVPPYFLALVASSSGFLSSCLRFNGHLGPQRRHWGCWPGISPPLVR